MKPYDAYLQDNEKKAVTLFVTKAKNCLGNNILNMNIFGSKIRGNFHQESDIDILLVVKKRDIHVRDAISEIAADLNIDYDCLLSPVIYTEAEYNRNQYFKNLFIENLATEGIAL